MSEKKDAEPPKVNPQKVITGIDTVVGADMERVVIHANKQLNYTSVKQHDPLGVILLFPETTFGGALPELAPDSEIIKSIIPSLSPDQQNTRLEIGLKIDSPYEVKKEGENINVVFLTRNMDAAPANQTEAASDKAVEEEPVSLSTVADLSSEKTDESSVEEKTASAEDRGLERRIISDTNKPPAVINRIDFSTQASGKSTIIVGTDFPAEFDIQKIAAKTLKIRVYNSRLPEYRRNRPLITTRFESAVDRISPIPAMDLENATDLIVELREWVPYRPVAEDNLLTIVFDKSSIGPRPFESANLPNWQKVLEEATDSAPLTDGQIKEQVGEEKDQYSDLLGEKKEYTGEKIALDFYKTDIKNVFRILQQVSGKNYAVDKNVTGEVTIALEKPVPWDQVLDLILKMNQLGKVEQGDIIRIATTATLSAEEVAQQNQLQAVKERMEKQKQLEPLVTEYISINYANAQSEILPHINDVLAKDGGAKGQAQGLSRGTITVDSRNNQVIITNTRANINKAREIIDQIDKVTPQVLIEARIVEVNDDFVREVGVSWGTSGEDIYKSNLDGQYSYNIAMNTPILATDVSPGSGIIDFNFTRLDAWGTPIVLDAALKAMERNGTGKIISSPKILTLDNKKAIIKQGLEVPYQTVDDTGQINIEFKNVDLMLEVTPHVTPDGRVSMQIVTTKNEIVSFILTGEPIISTNEANTELLVDDGETIVIGGVVKNDVKFTEAGFPILKDIPMIGWLFKSKNETNTKQELLIFITPIIVQLEQREIVRAEN